LPPVAAFCNSFIFNSLFWFPDELS